MPTMTILSNGVAGDLSKPADDEMTVQQYVGKWEAVTPFAASSSTKSTAKKESGPQLGATGMVMLQVIS